MPTHRVVIVPDVVTVAMTNGHARQRKDCIRVRCSCGWTSQPFFSAEPAELAQAEHVRSTRPPDPEPAP